VGWRPPGEAAQGLTAPGLRPCPPPHLSSAWGPSTLSLPWGRPACLWSGPQPYSASNVSLWWVSIMAGLWGALEPWCSCASSPVSLCSCPDGPQTQLGPCGEAASGVGCAARARLYTLWVRVLLVWGHPWLPARLSLGSSPPMLPVGLWGSGLSSCSPVEVTPALSLLWA